MAVDLSKYACKPVFGYMHPMVEDAIASDPVPRDSFRVVSDDRYGKWHKELISKYIKWVGEEVHGLDDVSWTGVSRGKWYSYPTMGSEEAIREVMLYLKEVKNAESIYVLHGEYEGYEAVAGTRGLPVLHLDPEGLLEATPGWVFLSTPSSRNGNVVDPLYIEALLDYGHKLVLDLAYLGTTNLEKFSFNVSHPGVFAVLTSFSKPFGMFYYRVGFAFTREEIPSLYANHKWFKCVPSLMAAEAVVDKVNRLDLRRAMKEMQLDAIRHIKSEIGMAIDPSDSWLLAHMYPEDASFLSRDHWNLIQPYRRGPFYRLCLTPYFEANRQGV